MTTLYEYYLYYTVMDQNMGQDVALLRLLKTRKEKAASKFTRFASVN